MESKFALSNFLRKSSATAPQLQYDNSELSFLTAQFVRRVYRALDRRVPDRIWVIILLHLPSRSVSFSHIMPLDTSTYHLSLLRLDGRRWNELRRLHAQISTQASADGSSYLEMGNTKVICTVAGPAEVRGAGGRREGAERDNAVVMVEIGVAGFSGVDRKRRRGDK